MDAVVTSEGERVTAPRFYRRGQRTLRRAQRSLSRKQKGSNNRAKARTRVARVHRKIANKRTDFCHKLTTHLVKNHAAVCVENLSLKELVRTKLAKGFTDAALGTMRRQLAYKGAWYRVHVVAVDRFYPSSKLCYECGDKNDALTLSDRQWTCLACGRVLDRDLNAARNIKREGLRLLAAGHADNANACGEHVRRPMGAALTIPT